MATKARPRIGDDAVKAKTGRNWQEWFAALDRKGARGRTHREIVAMAHALGAGPWWGQMVTVGYEQAHGQRAAHQVASGFTANVSRTFAAPVAGLAGAFESARTRAAWLRVQGVSVRSGTPGKVLRFDWPDGTRVEARFTGKAAAKSSVAIEHTRLAGAEDVARSKALWSEALERLRAKLEG